MPRKRVASVVLGLAVLAAAAATATGASAAPAVNDLPVPPNHERTLGPLGAANLANGVFFFVRGCNGNPAVGTIGTYQNATTIDELIVPRAGAPATITNTFPSGASLPFPVFSTFINDGTAALESAGPPPQRADFVTIDLTGGNTALVVGVDTGTRTLGPFTGEFAFVNVKDPNQNGLSGSPIVNMSAKVGEISFTLNTGFAPQMFTQPFTFNCDNVMKAGQAAQTILTDLGALGKAEAAGRRSEDRVARTLRAKFQHAESSLEDMTKTVSVDINVADYKAAAGAGTAIGKAQSALQTATAQLAAHIGSTPARSSVLRADKKVQADGKLLQFLVRAFFL